MGAEAAVAELGSLEAVLAASEAARRDAAEAGAAQLSSLVGEVEQMRVHCKQVSGSLTHLTHLTHLIPSLTLTLNPEPEPEPNPGPPTLGPTPEPSPWAPNPGPNP